MVTQIKLRSARREQSASLGRITVTTGLESPENSGTGQPEKSPRKIEQGNY